MIRVEYLGFQELIEGKPLLLVNRMDNCSTVVLNRNTMELIGGSEMDNYYRNIDTVNKGEGSEQARHKDCPECNMESIEEMVDLVDDGICPFCQKKVNLELLVTELDKKEYRISGLCKQCQDGTFEKME